MLLPFQYSNLVELTKQHAFVIVIDTLPKKHSMELLVEEGTFHSAWLNLQVNLIIVKNSRQEPVFLQHSWNSLDPRYNTLEA